MKANPPLDNRPSQGDGVGGDAALAARILRGEADAVAKLLADYRPSLRAYLGSLARNGRQQAIAEEIASDVLHLCSLPAGSTASGERLSLERYSGTGSLGAWLHRVAHFRFVNAIRRGEYRRTILATDLDEANPIDAMQRTLPPDPELDPEWLNVIRDALRDAVSRAGQESPEGIVFLRLVHMHEVQRQLLARVWKRHPAQVTRWLKESRERIRALTLETLKELDPISPPPMTTTCFIRPQPRSIP